MYSSLKSCGAKIVMTRKRVLSVEGGEKKWILLLLHFSKRHDFIIHAQSCERGRGGKQ